MTEAGAPRRPAEAGAPEGTESFADSHAHLDFSDYDADREQVFERARAAGVAYVLAMGGAGGPAQLRSGLAIAEGRENVWATSGIHPHEAQHAGEEHFAALEQLARHPKIVAIGEIGLDYHYDHSPRDLQQRVFLRQMEIAAAARLPLVIHCREAWDDCLRLLEEQWRRTGLGGILHCFSGTVEDARRGMELGFYVSFAGNITFPKANHLRETAAQAPRDRLLIETDCPFLAPVPYRGQRNEPAYVVRTAAQVAALHQCSVEEVACFTTRNFLEFVKQGRKM
ncbi:MAG TPA: TatD family hydrolase [Terriglobia bacterium]|nr:TatD family hydrolase [Terriglobia bacterium]